MMAKAKAKAEAAAAGAKAKAAELDAKHGVSDKANAAAADAKAKAAEVDQKHGISDKASKAATDAKAKAAEVDQKHGISDKTSKAAADAKAKAAEVDQKHGISDKASKAAADTKAKAAEVDEKHGISDKASAAGASAAASASASAAAAKNKVARMAGTPAESLVDCSKVFVKTDAWGGAGAFATVDIAEGEVVEKGIVRVLTNCDGNENPYVFTWSDEIPNVTWATGSGCSTFYNTCEEAESNTHMERDFAANSFVITATKDIKAGDELLHVYKSKKWRACFKDDLNPTPAEEGIPDA